MIDTQLQGIDSRVLNRVRGLLAKAESTEFAEEAAAFAAKAHELMTAYAIDAAMTETERGDDTITTIHIELHAPYVKDKYLLLSAVARPNRCRAILGLTREHLLDADFMRANIGKGRLATVLGHRIDLDAVEMLFTSLLLQATKSITERGSVIDGWGTNGTRAYRHAFLVGFADTIRERLDASTQQATAAATETSGVEVLPVLVDRAARVDEAVKETFPHLSPLKTSISSGSGLRDGSRAGHRADVGLTRVGNRTRQIG